MTDTASRLQKWPDDFSVLTLSLNYGSVLSDCRTTPNVITVKIAVNYWSRTNWTRVFHDFLNWKNGSWTQLIQGVVILWVIGILSHRSLEVISIPRLFRIGYVIMSCPYSRLVTWFDCKIKIFKTIAPYCSLSHISCHFP